MAFCGKCGTQLSDGAKFCPKCGNPTGSSETKEMAEENSANYCLELVSAGFAKLQVVKALREILDIGLKEAKDMVDSTPLEIAEGLTLTKAKEIASLLSTVGAKTIVKQNGKTIFIEEPSQNVNPQTEEQGGNKLIKYGTYVFAALCFFYIIGTCEGGSSDGQEETQIEQKQESPAEKQAREKREKEERQKDKINEIKRIAEREARITAQSLRYTDNWERHCQNSYISAFGTPSSDEDSKMYEIYKSEFSEKYFATLKAMQNMN